MKAACCTGNPSKMLKAISIPHLLQASPAHYIRAAKIAILAKPATIFTGFGYEK
jgi:hypothetical protein